MPFLSITYACAGIGYGLFWLCRQSTGALRALSGVILVMAALNGYAETWPRFKFVHFESAGLLLVLVFLWPYSLLSIRLMEGAGVARGARAFFASVLPVIYLLFLGMILVNLRDLATYDNPAFSMYVYVILVCALHVPTFAAGKARMIEHQGKSLRMPPSTAFRLPAEVPRSAAIALFVPLLIGLLLEVVTKDNWALFFLDATLSVSLAMLFVVSSGQGWRVLISHPSAKSYNPNNGCV